MITAQARTFVFDDPQGWFSHSGYACPHCDVRNSIPGKFARFHKGDVVRCASCKLQSSLDADSHSGFVTDKTNNPAEVKP